MTHKHNLQIQIEEMEMINSIFPQPGEFRKDRDSYSAVMAYVQGSYEFSPPPLVYSLKLTVDEVVLEVNITLPTSYPTEKPNVYLRETNTSGGSLNITELNKKLLDFMSDLEKDEICIYQLIVWLQENIMKYYTETTKSASQCILKDSTLSRYWIYSHHIYSKKKRKDILDLASKADLTGFVLPGRPGIICLEGCEQDCHESWVEIKTWSWHKIAVKTEEKNCALPRKFPTFEEVWFQGCSDRHMDMGKFLIFLKEHNCEPIFKEYFGCDGQIIDQM